MKLGIEKTCKGCDQVLKNIQDMTDDSKSSGGISAGIANAEKMAIGKTIEKGSVTEYMDRIVGEAKESSKDLVKKMKTNSKIKK
jgi:VIT1/CCC1 family predicted Fe2+/Mn2+ transporter